MPGNDHLPRGRLEAPYRGAGTGWPLPAGHVDAPAEVDCARALQWLWQVPHDGCETCEWIDPLYVTVAKNENDSSECRNGWVTDRHRQARNGAEDPAVRGREYVGVV